MFEHFLLGISEKSGNCIVDDFRMNAMPVFHDFLRARSH